MKEVWLAVIPATIPTLAVLVDILLNQNGLNELEVRFDGRINSLGGEIIALRKQLHIVMLAGRDTDKSERLAWIEERSKG